MHISVPFPSHTQLTATADGAGAPASGTDSALAPSAMANPYAVALEGLADIYLQKAWCMRSQEIDPGSPDNPKVSLAPADIRFLAHCGVSVEGQPIEEYINDKGNLLRPLELEQLAYEMRKRAAFIELEGDSAMAGRGNTAPVPGHPV